MKFNNILCIRQDNLGDVLITSPAMRALKESFPGTKLTLLASEMGAPVAPFIPEIDQTIIFTPPWVKSKKRANYPGLINILPKIKKEQFDLAVVFTNFSQNPLPAAMIPYLAGIPKRLAYCRENPYRLLTNWCPDPEPFSKITHGVQRQLKLVGMVGAKTNNLALSLKVTEAAADQALKKLKQYGADTKKPWIIANPGASEQKRRYPVNLFAQSINFITQKLKLQVIIIGTEEEKDLSNTILKQTGRGTYSLSGKLNLGETLGLISISPLLLSNNSGPVHIAAATQTPIVVLYARTNPEHTPWMVKNEVLYFDYPEKLKSRNEVLKYALPKNSIPLPQPNDILKACKKLLSEP